MINVPSFLQPTHAERFSIADSSIPKVVESASQIGVDDIALQPTCTSDRYLHTLQYPSEWHNKLLGFVGHVPRVIPSPDSNPSSCT